jgi:hypothetical protein
VSLGPLDAVLRPWSEQQLRARDQVDAGRCQAILRLRPGGVGPGPRRTGTARSHARRWIEWGSCKMATIPPGRIARTISFASARRSSTGTWWKTQDAHGTSTSPSATAGKAGSGDSRYSTPWFRRALSSSRPGRCRRRSQSRRRTRVGRSDAATRVQTRQALRPPDAAGEVEEPAGVAEGEAGVTAFARADRRIFSLLVRLGELAARPGGEAQRQPLRSRRWPSDTATDVLRGRERTADR